jgi:8-oxo-dGTP pyrophosphatase MutT (NUDIX family)
METDSQSIRQAAAIPIRKGQVCLVTSRSGKRWVIPKGCLEPGKTAGEVALQEAWEEAGLLGILRPEPVGTYRYAKWGKVCHVLVFLMRVTEVQADWPEGEQRRRIWLPPPKALARIEVGGLREIMQEALAACCVD